ncbi:MAG: EAL domain-containing protein [Bacillota bacterium]|nr:EAL domain-containing protein [Bacillota bacterium]
MNNKKGFVWPIIAAYIIMYIVTMIMQFRFNKVVMISGVVAQLQVITSVFLVIFLDNVGYKTAVIINSFQEIEVLIVVVLLKTHEALPGTIQPICTIITMYFLINTIRYLKDKINETAFQKEQLNYLAHYDSLVNIPNRTMVIDHINELINKSKKEQLGFALVFVDLDDFKKINDLLGHGTGDEFLIAVVSKICKIIKPDDMFGRIGGDEFALIIHQEVDKDKIINYLTSIMEVLNNNIELGDLKLKTTASFGVSIYPYDGNTCEDLIKCADMAMYKVKSSGKNGIKFFNKDMKDAVLQKIEIENNLRAAIDGDELYVVFQPQYNIIEKKLRGFEALVRWQCVKLGFISTESMIPIAEETGLIVSIGEWILRRACREFKQIIGDSDDELILSVNVSTVQLMKSSFVDMIKDVLYETGLNPNQLELEITESVFISSVENATKILKTISNLGVRIALDDFGTGYSSLSYLQKLPINTLKIDKSFIDNINDRKQFVGDIISIMHQMDIIVIAEGVEDESQFEYLRRHDCDCIQGFLLGRPQRMKELMESKFII